jgi:hypothetical protein
MLYFFYENNHCGNLTACTIPLSELEEQLEYRTTTASVFRAIDEKFKNKTC